MTKHLTILAVALLLTSLAFAQAPANLTGTITFRGGESLSGIIKAADLGIMDGTGVGTGLNGFGSIKINVNGAKQTVPAASIKLIEATWVDKSTPEEPSWEISELRVTTSDGKVLVGKPDWHMHATNVSVQLASGETKRVHAFPLGGADFSPNNLIAKIELGVVAAAETPAATTPAATTPAATTPAATTPAATTPTPTTAETPAATTPAATTPAATTPAPTTTVEVTPNPTPAATTPTPAATTPAPAATTPAPAAVTAAVAAQAANVKAGEPMVIKVPVAGTNKVVNILIYVSITDGGVEVMPGGTPR